MSQPPTDALLRAADEFWDELGVSAADSGRTLCFIGTLSRQLDIATILAAAAVCTRLHLPWRFVLCGVGDRLTEFKERARSLSNVRFPGWVDRAQIHVLMRRSVAGLDPLPDRYDFLATINNKAIEYLSAGLPVISSPRRGVLAELLAARRCGLSYEAGDTNGLLQLLKTMTPATLQEFSANSSELFRERFTAEKVYADMADYLEELARTRKSPVVSGHD